MAVAICSLLILIFVLSPVRSVPVDGNSIDQPEENESFANEAALIDGQPTDEGDEEEDEIIDLSRVATEMFRNPDNDTGKMLELYSPDSAKNNPEELGSYLQGDILVKKAGRNGLISQSSKWPGGVVPFVIRGSFNAREMDVIERGIKQYHAKTCIRFKPRTNENDYISFENDPSGCWSSVGKIGGKQEVNLQTPGCFTKDGTFLHEVMHALGFLHEQNRYERDSYVDIVWQNIQSSTRTNFDKASSSTTNAYGVGYDYDSVMHYSAHAFSTNGRPTIVAKDSSAQSRLGQRDGFSTRDLQKLNAMYCRNSRPPNGHSRPPSGHNPNTNSRPTSRPTSRPQRPRPPNGYPSQTQRPGYYPNPSGYYPPPQGNYPPPQRPSTQRPGNNGGNNPILNFFGGLISGLFQEEGSQGDRRENDSKPAAPIGQPRELIGNRQN